MGLLFALLPILSGLLSGGSAAGVLATLSLSDWIGLAGALLDAEPSVVTAIRALHPAFDQLVADLKLSGPKVAGTNAWKRRQPKTIPGYLSDGSFGAVPNPDYLAS